MRPHFPFSQHILSPNTASRQFLPLTTHPLSLTPLSQFLRALRASIWGSEREEEASSLAADGGVRPSTAALS